MNPMRRLKRSEEGSVLVLTAMVLPVVIAFLGLMLDGALLLADRRELQDAADMAGLAGAMQLDMAFFAQTGQWRIADTSNIPGSPTSHQAAEEVCAEYRVTCYTDLPTGRGRREFHVIAERTSTNIFMHLFTGTRTFVVQAEATTAMVPGF